MPEPSGAPTSWAADLNSYRTTVGNRSYGTLDQTTTSPTRYARTSRAPLGDVNHPMYSMDEQRDGPAVRVEMDTYPDRMRRHGLGGVTLLHHDQHDDASGQSGPSSPMGGAESPSPKGGRRALHSPRAVDGRKGMWGVIAQTEAGQPDSWIGHHQASPGKGKRSGELPPDSKGRKDLFEVLNASTPGKSGDDSWMGNALIDPARHRAAGPGAPEQRGRTGLGPIINQQILRDERRLDLLGKGADPMGDQWCGHILIDPARGKGTDANEAAGLHELMMGSGFKKPPPPGHSDLPRRHNRSVEPPYTTTVPDIVSGCAQGDDWGRVGRRSLPAPLKPDRPDLYSNMQFRPLSDAESVKYSKSWDDGAGNGARPRVVNPPGSQDIMKGPDMLTWRPELRLATHVPHGSLAQQKNRTQPLRP